MRLTSEEFKKIYDALGRHLHDICNREENTWTDCIKALDDTIGICKDMKTLFEEAAEAGLSIDVLDLPSNKNRGNPDV